MTDVSIPDDFWGDDAEGVIATWLFADGEAVTQGAALAEVMYAKASMELLAPATGILRILVPVETPIRRGEVVARIG
jgi:pyruvate/2-oxoglutarate dehydrogenase complex dihydrolipoamide acyltransferase (E2) component